MIFNYMELSILLEYLPDLYDYVYDEDGSIVNNEEGIPQKIRVPQDQINFKQRYVLLNDLSRLKEKTEDENLKIYIYSLINKIQSLSNDDLNRIYEDYLNNRICCTERYLLI